MKFLQHLLEELHQKHSPIVTNIEQKITCIKNAEVYKISRK